MLRRFASYEVREYQPFLVAEIRTGGGEAAGFNTGGAGSRNAFDVLAGFIFGGNEKGTKMEMTTPVMMGGGKMRFMLSSKTYNNEVGPGRSFSPRRRILAYSRSENSKCVSMTQRAIL